MSNGVKQFSNIFFFLRGFGNDDKVVKCHLYEHILVEKWILRVWNLKYEYVKILKLNFATYLLWQ